MKRFQELLMKDLGWKLLSVAIAATMWFMVISINQPIDTRTYSTTLVLEGEESLAARGLTIANREELEEMKIGVKIKAQRTSLDRLSQRQAELISASIDLSALNYVESGDVLTLPVTTNIANGAAGYTVESKTPSSVDVKVETLVSKEFPVQISWNGETPSDMMQLAPILSSKTVMVKGAQSLVNSVAVVRVFVNVADAQEHKDTVVTPVAYDKEGNTVRGVIFSEESITISYHRTQEEKEVPIVVDTTGTPAEGYHVVDINVAPQTVRINAAPEILQNIQSIPLNSIDVNHASANVTKTISLASYLPKGVSVIGQSSVQVTIYITKGEERQFDISSGQITVQNGKQDYTYTIPDGQMILMGRPEDLTKVQVSAITGKVDVANLEDGESTNIIEWMVPDGIQVVSSNITVTAVSKAEEPPTEHEDAVESLPIEPPTVS